MEEQMVQPGLLTRLKEKFFGIGIDEEDYEPIVEPGRRLRVSPYRTHSNQPYQITIRKEIHVLNDASVAADELKDGVQQILNLSNTKPEIREKVIDFLNGVVYALNGTVQKVGDNVYVYAPHQAHVDTTQIPSRFRNEED